MVLLLLDILRRFQRLLFNVKLDGVGRCEINLSSIMYNNPGDGTIVISCTVAGSGVDGCEKRIFKASKNTSNAKLSGIPRFRTVVFLVVV